MLIIMRRNFHIWAILFASILAIHYASASRIKRQSSENDMMGINKFLDSLKSMMGGLPLIGGMIGKSIDLSKKSWMGLQDLTNGALGRVLGGAFPCKVSLDGLSCSGVTTKSSLHDIVNSLIDPIPGLLFPQFLKKTTLFFVDAFGVSIIDVLFGGVPMSAEKSR